LSESELGSEQLHQLRRQLGLQLRCLCGSQGHRYGTGALGHGSLVHRLRVIVVCKHGWLGMRLQNYRDLRLHGHAVCWADLNERHITVVSLHANLLELGHRDRDLSRLQIGVHHGRGRLLEVVNGSGHLSSGGGLLALGSLTDARLVLLSDLLLVQLDREVALALLSSMLAVLARISDILVLLILVGVTVDVDGRVRPDFIEAPAAASLDEHT